ncbi:MAG: NUDIX domain-containing protein [Candidatus Paceibacterota bacterium]
MEIRSTLTNRAGEVLEVVYREDDPTKALGDVVLQGVHGYCFCGEKLVVVYAESKGRWTPPGGGIEEGETFEEALTREVLEETNMNVIYQEYIGHQDIYESEQTVRQTRSFCSVEPLGEFVSDPDGEITEIKLIDPREYKQYFDWGTIGDHLFARALECRGRYDRSR